MKILILGVTGMLGNAFFKQLSKEKYYQVYGTLRNASGRQFFQKNQHSQLLINVDILDQDSLVAVFEHIRPDIVINCVGIIKQLENANSPLNVLPINSMLPHRLDHLCSLAGVRLVHFSSDCVFSGKKGMYKEQDLSDAQDLYGKSKFIGEINDSQNSITLRTSIIGHELGSNHSLVDWFLSQKSPVKGYSKAVFSGLPSVEMARIVNKYIIPKPELSGVYHVSAVAIDKLSLLKIVAKEYKKDIEIIPDEQLCIDRSLDSTLFRQKTGYAPAEWSELVKMMYELR